MKDEPIRRGRGSAGTSRQIIRRSQNLLRMGDHLRRKLKRKFKQKNRYLRSWKSK